MKVPYKRCVCGIEFKNYTDFIDNTYSIGLISTLEYMSEDLELRNCDKCLTTLTHKVGKGELK